LQLLVIAFFYIQRIPSSCVETALNSSTIHDVSMNCFTFDWIQITNLTTNYSTYINPTTNQTFYAQIGALTVLGIIDNYNINFQCPPPGYNGVGPGCAVQNNTQLVIVHINALDGKLYAMDIILSGSPFPLVQSLQNNQPPFGRARHIFQLGITIQSSGYFKICKKSNSIQCPYQSDNARQLPYPLPSNYGYGIFGIQAFDLVTNSTWIMDDPNQLLIVTAGVYYYYFNQSGFFMYDSSIRTCTWSSSCNYQCEVYNYNSRFLDYAGEWIIIKKWGINRMQPLAVDAWIGNAIDAAGIFPIIMYTDKITGHYLGLDKLDPTPSAEMGATYWYTEHGNTIPRTNILAFHPNAVETGCTADITMWTGVQKNNASTAVSINIQMVLAVVFLKIFQFMWAGI
jgi:hypothetical protein